MKILIGLCPLFLRRELEITSFSRDYVLLGAPVFKLPAKKLLEDEELEAKVELLRGAIKNLEASIRASDPDRVKEQLGKLMLHKGIGNYNEGQWKALMGDYVKFLGKYPFDLIVRACEECICDPSQRYFPQVGVLINKMTRGLAIRCLYLARLRKILELSSPLGQREFEPKAKNPVEYGARLAAKFKV